MKNVFFQKRFSQIEDVFQQASYIFLECEPGIAFLSPGIVNNEKIPPNIEYGKSRGKLVFGNTGGERK